MRKSKGNIVKEAMSEAKMRERRVKVNGKSIKIVRESGYLYYTKGDPISIYRTKMQHRGRTKSKQPSTLVLKTKATRTTGFLFYVDKEGFLAKAKMARRKKK